MPRAELLQFLCNVPVQVALLTLDPLVRESTSGTQYFYPTSEGKGFWAPEELHAKIRNFQPAVNEPFFVCKRRAHGKRRMWDLWKGAPVGTHEAESSQSTLELQLARSLDRLQQPPAPQPIPIRAEAPQAKGTGTYGPVPIPAVPPTRRKDEKIPLDVAVREVIGFVTTSLKDCGEQWTDHSKQDLISTVIIAATKAGYTTVWNREGVA
jgi:hypothetical protein